ncbi:hypothetical protein DMUE_5141 [Dictyocoela muelleri]|nr:hypothetical protein DMUE_5141 [Dictyocoela muelleri]
MKTDGEELMILDNGFYNTYGGNWEMNRANNIIYNLHNPSHLSADKLHKKICNEYIGIKRDIIRDYVKKCEACNMAEPLKRKTYLTYINSRNIYKRLFLYIIDFKKIF